jgi:hypothetical protein
VETPGPEPAGETNVLNGCSTKWNIDYLASVPRGIPVLPGSPGVERIRSGSGAWHAVGS